MVLLMVPITLMLLAAGASVWLLAVWLLANGAFALFTACPECRQSIYWEERNPLLTLLARPHRRCTRCGFQFQWGSSSTSA